MLLNEIFDTKNSVSWKNTSSGYEGSFEVDGELYTIDVEEYSIELSSGKKSVIDVGFKKNGSSNLTGDAKPARVLGSLLNGLSQKSKELKPNIIMFGALTINGQVEKRMEIYDRAASLIRKSTAYDYKSRWYKISVGIYMFIADFTPSEEDEKLIEKLTTHTK